MVKTLEQQARDLLDRVGVEESQSFTAGELVELANMIGEVNAYRLALGTLQQRYGAKFIVNYSDNFISNKLDEMVREEDIKRRNPLTGRDLDKQVAEALTKKEAERLDALAEKRIREIVQDELKKLVITLTKA